jgi:hypothetical protein
MMDIRMISKEDQIILAECARMLQSPDIDKKSIERLKLLSTAILIKYLEKNK